MNYIPTIYKKFKSEKAIFVRQYKFLSKEQVREGNFIHTHCHLTHATLTYLCQMPPNKKKSNNNILNNLKDHVDTGDVLFVVSGESPNNQQAIDAFNCCKSKCPGRRKLDRNLHSKVVDASEFEAVCDQPKCTTAKKYAGKDDKSVKNKVSEMKLEKGSKNAGGKKPKRFEDPSNQNRKKTQGPPPADKNRKREIILRQLKNHRVSTTSMDDGSSPKLM